MNSNESLILVKVASSMIIFLWDFLAGCLPIWFRKFFRESNRNMSIAKCIAGGILLCSSLLQLLNNAEKQPSIDPDGPSIGFPIVHFMCGTGFLFIMLVEYGIASIQAPNARKMGLFFDMIPVSRTGNVTISIHPSHLSHRRQRELLSDDNDDDEDDDGTSTVTTVKQKCLHFSSSHIFFMVLCMESFMTGLTIGMQTESSKIWIFTLVIICHDWAEAISLIIYFMEIIKKNKWFYLLLAVYASSTSIGIYTGIGLMSVINSEHSDLVASALSAFTAGTFIFIATIEMIAKELSSSYVSTENKNNNTSTTTTTTTTTTTDYEMLELKKDNSGHSHASASSSDMKQTRNEILIKIMSVLIGYSLSAVLVFILDED